MRYPVSVKIAYCTNVRLPSERAHGHQIAQVCNALADLGHQTEIFAPKRFNTIKEDFQTYYDANKTIQIQYLKGFDHVQFPFLIGPLGLWVDNFLLRRGLKKQFKNEQFDILYTRTSALLLTLLQSKIPVILELHKIPRRNQKSFIRQCNQCVIVVCLTSLMRDELVRLGVDESRVIVEGDAVDSTSFTRINDGEVYRKKHNIQNNVPVIGYAGQLESMGLSKGVEVLVEACEILIRDQVDFHLVIAGGPDITRDELIDSLTPEAKERIHFLGILSHQQIPSVLTACDVLVYPAPKSSNSFYQRDTSPLKLFEYMAAGKPIVCADLPPLHDIASEENVFFFAPGDAQDCAKKIAYIFTNPEEAMQKVIVASESIKDRTWNNRLDRILNAVKSHI